MFTVQDVRKQLKIMGFNQHISDQTLKTYIDRIRQNPVSPGGVYTNDKCRPTIDHSGEAAAGPVSAGGFVPSPSVSFESNLEKSTDPEDDFDEVGQPYTDHSHSSDGVNAQYSAMEKTPEGKPIESKNKTRARLASRQPFTPLYHQSPDVSMSSNQLSHDVDHDHHHHLNTAEISDTKTPAHLKNHDRMSDLSSLNHSHAYSEAKTLKSCSTRQTRTCKTKYIKPDKPWKRGIYVNTDMDIDVYNRENK
eukprot:663084-Amorphochlora_amoeboformis.AAC.1